MILQVHERWEVKNDLFTAFTPPGMHCYAMVEMGLNVPLFLTELLMTNDDGEEEYLWQTYLLTEIDKAISLINSGVAVDHAISILLPRNVCPDREFAVSTLIEVIDACSEDKLNRMRIFVCANGTRFIEPDFKIPESDLIRLRQIYSKNYNTTDDTHY